VRPDRRDVPRATGRGRNGCRALCPPPPPLHGRAALGGSSAGSRPPAGAPPSSASRRTTLRADPADGLRVPPALPEGPGRVPHHRSGAHSRRHRPRRGLPLPRALGAPAHLTRRRAGRRSPAAGRN
jgi:hypothetical protein